MLPIDLMTCKRLTRLITSMCLAFFATVTHANYDIDAFIANVKTVTYDCPNPQDFDALNALLATNDLSESQRFSLSVAKSHFLLCNGQVDEAETLLFDTVATPDIDKESYFYASAIYQIGFAYDMKEQEQRCDYYQQAQNLSSPKKHSDVFLSASLGLITYCQQGGDVGQRLGKMFSILKRYSTTGNAGELAHIHNAIGLIYGTLDQHVLAAEQYLKAHEIGLEVYTGSNQLSILISAITSLLASGQYDKAYEAIIEFDTINQSVQSPLTNFYYYHALSGYYYRTGKYDDLNRIIPDLRNAVNQVSNPFYQSMVDWYSTASCVRDGDKECVRAYLSLLEGEGAYVPRSFEINLDYLAFFMRAQLLLGNSEKVENTFLKYQASAKDRRINNQYSASILGVANLHSRIYDLESEVQSAEELRRNMLYGSIAVFFICALIVAYVLRKRQLERLSIDSVTKLLNSETVVSRISKIDAPEQGRANAIAIFDLGNFRELNRAVGSTRSDYILRQIANTLQKVTRGTDLLGRFAPEQFILCLQNIDEESAKAFFERVQNELDNTFEGETDAHQISVRSSMSIFVSTEKITNLNDVLDEMLLSISVKARHD